VLTVLDHHLKLSRRRLLAVSGAAAATAVLPTAPARAASGAVHRLVAAAGEAHLVGAPYPQTAVWSYNGTVPGPEIRARQGERLHVEVVNRLEQETTVHWHGLRLPNAMDGVPHLTQPPIALGGSFTYAFDLPDAGTFWYHPHARSFEQVGRGLSGPLIVEEPDPPRIDRDLVWVLGDWRLGADAQIGDDFGNLHDISHAGRLGNTVTINGKVPEDFPVRAGERLRLRLINVANARIFGLEFEGHEPQVIAIDGQPVEPHEPEGGRVVLGPGMRADLILDLGGRPGERLTVVDGFDRGRAYRLVDLAYGEEPPLREGPLDAPVRLPANPLPEPDLAAAERHELRFAGGMMGGMMGGMRGMREMMRHGLAWTVNGIAASGHDHAPLLTLERDRSCVLTLVNDTAFHHPIHLHGHAFRVISRDGRPTRHREWQDTVLIAPRETVEVAFVADNPGKWMIHCHALEHQAGGMSGVIRVA
jgi:FtsP/CotA-like multicopper oxidase with cupredoxin domain